MNKKRSGWYLRAVKIASDPFISHFNINDTTLDTMISVLMKRFKLQTKKRSLRLALTRKSRQRGSFRKELFVIFDKKILKLDIDITTTSNMHTLKITRYAQFVSTCREIFM